MQDINKPSARAVPDFEERREAKRERLEERAEKHAKEAARRFDTAHQIGSMIPFGQPILVGHHSEKRHRRDIDRIDTNMRKGIEAERYSNHLAARAESLGSGRAISSDDPEALDKLRAKLAEMETLQTTMKATNKVVRAFLKAGCRHDNDAEELARYFEKVAEAGITSQTLARELLKPDFCKRTGFADYQLTNNNANIRRIRQRIAELEKLDATPTTEREVNGVIYREEENRVRLIFDGKPSDDVRALLKSRGFRWSPRAGAWQRQLNNAGRYAAQFVLEKLQALQSDNIAANS